MTTHELARCLKVSERTIHRAVEARCAAGVPVYAVRGARGGWVLQNGDQTNLTGLHEQEILALCADRSSRLLVDKARDTSRRLGSPKCSRRSRRDDEYTRQWVCVDMTGWNRVPESADCLPILLEAIWRERTLRLTYHRSDGASVERLVDPPRLAENGKRVVSDRRG